MDNINKEKLSDEELNNVHGGSEIKTEIARKYNKKVSDKVKNTLCYKEIKK